MARIELKNCTISLRDGFHGAAAVNDTPSMGDTTVEIDNLNGLTNALTIVPVGARFKVEDAPNTKFVVTAQNANDVWTLTFTADAGDVNLVVDGEAVLVNEADTASDVQDAFDSAIGAGNSLVTGTAGDYRFEFIGDYAETAVEVTVDSDTLEFESSPVDPTLTHTHTGGTTWQLTFTPAFASGQTPGNNDIVTFYPQELNIKIGEGDLKYTENTPMLYDTDRGRLDTVRLGVETPMDVSLDAVYEHITTGTNETISPMDALKRTGAAAGWLSSAEDQCEPYAVDLVVVHTPPCGTNQIETTVFPDLRCEKREVSFKDAKITITGKCNAIEPIVTRG